jgi:hypothetical protein
MRDQSLPLKAQYLGLKERFRENPALLALGGLLGLGLGVVFCYTGLQKHLAPYQFAEAILAYQLIPQTLVGYVAAILPWVELTPGFFLALGYGLEGLGRLAAAVGLSAGNVLVGGIKRRSCLLLIMLLATLFIIVLSVTLARGLKIDCGCGLFFQRQVGLAAILENFLILAVAGALYWWELPVAVEARRSGTI